MTLDADGQIAIYEIETGRIVAEYHGLEVHNRMNLPDGWLDSALKALTELDCPNCGELSQHIEIDSRMRCCACSRDNGQAQWVNEAVIAIRNERKVE